MFGGEDPSYTVIGVGIRPGRTAVGTWGLLPAGEPQPSRMGFELFVGILWPIPQKKTEQTAEDQSRGFYSLGASLAPVHLPASPLLLMGERLRSLSLPHAMPTSVPWGHPLCQPPQESRTGLPRLSGSHKPMAFLHGFSS